MNAVDTNVWVYAFDRAHSDKQVTARQLLLQLERDGECLLLWQVVSELTNCLRRWVNQAAMTLDDVEKSIGSILERFPSAVPERTTVLTALDLSRRHSLSHWDSMLLAACIEAGVTTLYSEDLSHGVRYDSVLVVNPFAK